MNIIDRLKTWLQDPSREFQERIFLVMTLSAEIVLTLVFIADIILNENITEILILGGTLVFSPIVSYLSLKNHRIDVVSKIIAIAVIFVILPVSFFFGGGLYGGPIIWFSFAYLYIGLLLTGKWRIIMIAALTLLALFEYYVGYYHPEFIVPHTTKMFYLDSLVSVLLVGLVIIISVMFQNRLFMWENERAKEEAKKVEELNLAQSRFFSSMSHEIRTPINTIIGLNEMILRENISDEVAEDAASISSASRMLLHLINDILDMSKLESGQMQLTPVVYRPGDMLSELVGMLWLRAKQKNIEFRVNVAPNLPSELFADEVRIKQILINVLNNAIKYTKEGSVSLSIQPGERNGNTLNIIYTVSDTGIGIKKEDIPYLFTAFRRVDESENRHIEGTGLGLSIVKQFADLMGGKITVNSVYTKGSTFIIELPQQIANEQGVGEIDIEKRHEMNVRQNYFKRFEAPDAKVLVVDDNESNLLVVKKLLRDTKVNIDTVTSGAEALKKTLNTEYHVIFMDHLMPEMDGIECHRAIRSQVGGSCRNSKVVALTANAGGDSRVLYESEGFDGYLVKPISGDELEKELCRLLPSDIVYLSGNDSEIFEETISWLHSDQKKKNIIITTESVADLPQEIIDTYGIAVLPHMVCTEEGTFKDGLEIETTGLLNYMNDASRHVETRSPDVKAHEEFFAEQLAKANNIIHISISSSVANSGCVAANEAAKAFDNVTVIDTGHLSSGQGIMVIEACKLAKADKSPEEITRYLEKLKSKVSTSFVVDNLEFLARAHQVSKRVANITRSFMARPVLVLKKGKMSIGSVYFGSRERAWKRYINHVLSKKNDIDNEILFITHAGLSRHDLNRIKEYAESRMKFKHVYFHKASPAIAVNCGAGTFGLLLRYKD